MNGIPHDPTTDRPDPSAPKPRPHDERAPVTEVFRWLEFIIAHDFEEAWAWTDVTLRLRRSQAWLWANRTSPDLADLDLDEEAERLASTPSTSDLWELFALAELNGLHEAWQAHFAAHAEGRLKAWSRRRFLGPDLEAVVLMETKPDGSAYENTWIRVMTFWLRITDTGWKVANY